MREINPAQTKRAEAFALWMHAPMPMITLLKTLDVTNLVRLSRRGWKFNLLLCWCIGKAASHTGEFYLLPFEGKLMQYECLAVNTVVSLPGGGISTCDIPFSCDPERFRRDYLTLTAQVQDTGREYNLGEDYMVIGTSALARYEIDGAVNIYAGIYNNPFLIWGKYRKRFLRAILPISFQFHHVQMDGQEAAEFLEILQEEINRLKIN